MKGQLRHKILDDLKLIVVHYSGVLTVDELIEQLNNRNENSAYNPLYNTIYDFRDCKFDVKLAEFSRSEEVGQTTPGYNTGKKVALITDKPKETLLLISFVKALHHHKSIFEVFPGISAAMQFVGIPSGKKNQIEKVLTELRTADHS